MTLTPISLSEANAFVALWHRHHKPVVGHKFSIGCEADGRLAGVAIVGRPVSRYLDDGKTLEVNRLCTDGTKNACSFLYAAGWCCAGRAGGTAWTGSRAPKAGQYPAQMKLRYEKTL